MWQMQGSVSALPRPPNETALRQVSFLTAGLVAFTTQCTCRLAEKRFEAEGTTRVRFGDLTLLVVGAVSYRSGRHVE